MGANAQVLTIGPAGENLVRFATVQHSEENAAGHSGFGAVWGSKRLKAIVAIWSQHQHVVVDTLPLCDFAFPQLVRSMDGAEEWRATEDISGDLDFDLRVLEAVTGEALSREELTRIAERTCTLERALLARVGRHRMMEEALAPHFRLPCRADRTSIDSAGFSRLLDEYYAARGWDRKLGWPEPELLRRLGLEEVIPELAERRLGLGM